VKDGSFAFSVLLPDGARSEEIAVFAVEGPPGGERLSRLPVERAPLQGELDALLVHGIVEEGR
jgi:hypothetical protein